MQIIGAGNFLLLCYNGPMKQVGKVSHYYDKLGVAIINLSASLKVGDKIKFEGHGAQFEQTVDSMQIEHDAVEKAKKGDAVGVKVVKKVKEGTTAYFAE